MFVSMGAASLDHRTSDGVRAAYLPADLQWVDHARLGSVALLQTPGADAGRSLDQLFWNRSIRRVLVLPGARAVDTLGAEDVRVAADGELVGAGRVVRKSLLVPTTGASILLSGASRVARAAGFELWRPTGNPHLRLLAVGREGGGRLARTGWIMVWPGRAAGVLHLALSVPPGLPAGQLTLRGPGVASKVSLGAGTSRMLSIPVRAGPPFRLAFRTAFGGSIRADRLLLEPPRA
jgi:hypothetical protein